MDSQNNSSCVIKYTQKDAETEQWRGGKKNGCGLQARYD